MRSALVLLLCLTACDAPSVGHGEPHFAPLAADPHFAPPLPGTPDLVPAPPVPAAPRPTAAPPAAASPTHSWNSAQIAWRPFDDGLAEARRTHKPLLLVFYASWCVHCSNFSHVFDDAAVVAAARDFVMVRADSDQERALNARFAPDGQYIPRTFFLSPDGAIVPGVKAHEGQFQYFYNEHEPAPLLAAMRSARLAVR